MSGDVFGNAMWLAPYQLLGASTIYIFSAIPIPIRKKSFQERERCSSCRAPIGPITIGDPIARRPDFDRLTKSLQLTPEIMAWLGLSEDRISPPT